MSLGTLLGLYLQSTNIYQVFKLCQRLDLKKIIIVSQCANKLAQDHRLSSSNEEMVIVPGLVRAKHEVTLRQHMYPETSSAS